MSKIRLIHEVHDMWPATLIEIGGMSPRNIFIRLLQRAEDQAYRKSDAVVSIPSHAEEYMMKHGLAKGKFVHIPNGIFEEDWQESKELPEHLKTEFENFHKQGKFIIGYFGGHALSNTLDTLLDCAKNFLENKKIIFILVGKGVEKERLKKRCVNEQIDNIVFFDAIEKKCIPSLLKEFDCVYMGAMESPLYHFGISMNKFYDAMMAGKPIILSASAPLTIIEQFHCGIVVPAGNVEKITDAIEKLLIMKPEERNQLGENGKLAVQENFTYKKLAKQFEDIMGDSQKKNILLINHYAGTPDMGMEFRPYYFAREWSKKGYRVDIIAADYSHLRIQNPKIDRDFKEQIIDDIHYHWVHTRIYTGNGVKRALTMFEFVGKLWVHAKVIARKFKPDVIITSSTYPLDTYAGQRIRKFSEKLKEGDF